MLPVMPANRPRLKALDRVSILARLSLVERITLTPQGFGSQSCVGGRQVRIMEGRRGRKSPSIGSLSPPVNQHVDHLR
jgi:hypothetical protein